MPAEHEIDHWQDVAGDAEVLRWKAKQDYSDAWERVEFLVGKVATELTDEEIDWIWHVDAGGVVPDWLVELRSGKES